MTIDRFAWTAHAEMRLRQRGLARESVELALRERHANREINRGPADWRIEAGHFVVIYDHPDRGDPRTVRIVSVWAKRQEHRRS